MVLCPGPLLDVLFKQFGTHCRPVHVHAFCACCTVQVQEDLHRLIHGLGGLGMTAVWEAPEPILIILDQGEPWSPLKVHYRNRTICMVCIARFIRPNILNPLNPGEASIDCRCDHLSMLGFPPCFFCPRNPVVPSQKVRLDPPGTYITVSPITF